jgi:hypothetical protein
MAIVTEISWDDMLDGKPLPENPVRTAWHEAVAEIAAKAKAVLPECNGRVVKATQLVLNGDVQLLPNGTAKVASQSNGETVYHIANGTCDCADFPSAPHGQCKHKIARGIYLRATALAKQRLAQLDSAGTGQTETPSQPGPAQPEAPVETSQGIPPQHVVLIQGRPFVKFTGLLQMAHERGLVALTADWTYNDGELSLAHAVATFQDGRRFEESGDATPANTNRKVTPTFGASP